MGNPEMSSLMKKGKISTIMSMWEPETQYDVNDEERENKHNPWGTMK